MSYLLGSMSGVLTAHSMRLTAPSIAKRALGPHLGDFYEKFFPYWKCPKIFSNTRKGRKEMIVDKVKVSSGIAGLMSYDPGKVRQLIVVKSNLIGWRKSLTTSLANHIHFMLARARKKGLCSKCTYIFRRQAFNVQQTD
jgi:hypothetical protein